MNLISTEMPCLVDCLCRRIERFFSVLRVDVIFERLYDYANNVRVHEKYINWYCNIFYQHSFVRIDFENNKPTKTHRS